MYYLFTGVRCLVGAVFLLSALGKVAGRGAFTAFTASIPNLLPVSAAGARAVALVVVPAEFAVCALLVIPLPTATAAGFVIATGLLLSFTVAIVSALRSGNRAACRCFGPSAAVFGLHHVIRNTVLAVLAGTGATTAWTTAWTTDPATHPGGVLLAVCAGLLLGGLVAVLDDVLTLFRPLARARQTPVADTRRNRAHPDRRRSPRGPDRRGEPAPRRGRDQAPARAHRAAVRR